MLILLMTMHDLTHSVTSRFHSRIACWDRQPDQRRELLVMTTWRSAPLTQEFIICIKDLLLEVSKWKSNADSYTILKLL